MSNIRERITRAKRFNREIFNGSPATDGAASAIARANHEFLIDIERAYDASFVGREEACDLLQECHSRAASEFMTKPERDDLCEQLRRAIGLIGGPVDDGVS
jgi:hypothetical protein